MKSTPAEAISNREESGLAVRIFAAAVSYLFHPVFIPIYVILYLLFIHPDAFAGFSDSGKNQTLVITILNLVIFPLVSVFLLKALGFIESIFLRTQKDRIIPYIACGIFFFWTYTVFKQQPQYPTLLTSFVLGIFLSSSAALICNIYFKISMHTIGMGSWTGFFLMLWYAGDVLISWPLATVILLSGLVGTARLMLKSHRPLDVYAGFLVGLILQWIAFYFVAQ